MRFTIGACGATLPYNIVDEADLAEGVAKLAALHAQRRTGTIGAESNCRHADFQGGNV